MISFTVSSLARADVVDNLTALLLEGLDPLSSRPDAPWPVRGRWATGEARDVKQIAQLLVGQLRQQAGEELAALLADPGIRQCSGIRLTDVRDAPARILPDGCGGPIGQVRAPVGSEVGFRRAPECQAHILDKHEG